MVIKNKMTNPQRNKISAICSYLLTLVFTWPLIARNDNKQLPMKQTMAKVAPSSKKEPASNLVILLEVSTTKQKPNKVAEVLRICGDLEGRLFIYLVTLALGFLPHVFILKNFRLFLWGRWSSSSKIDQGLKLSTF